MKHKPISGKGIDSLDEKPIIRIAFFGYENFGWTGGLNYLKNLLTGISLQEDRKIQCFLFVSRLADPKTLELFKGLVKIVSIPGSDPIGLGLKATDKIFKTKFFINFLLKKYRINVVSHSYKEGIPRGIKKIAWIPDFQHLHLPEMFSSEELRARNQKFLNKISWADIVVLSSENAATDFKKFSPFHQSKARILNFVSNIEQEIYSISKHQFQKYCAKHKIPEKFFFLPNQFWNHKNHKIVFKAVEILKKQGTNIKIVCTGNMSTKDVSENVTALKVYIEKTALQNNIYLLGLIDYKEVQAFFRYCISVINPSFFEGWSTTVEESKSFGKSIILSDIPVHKEQSPENVVYFDPGNETQLAEILKTLWLSMDNKPNIEEETKAKKQLSLRLKIFGEDYVKILEAGI